MTFTKEFLSNSVYAEQPVAFSPLRDVRLNRERDPAKQKTMKAGAIVQENGDILFRIYAPTAQTVTVKVASRECVLARKDEYCFEGLYPYDPKFCGPHSVDVILDGCTVLDPYLPVFWHRNRAVNFIEVPDPETDYIQIKDVPHGMVSENIYWSKALQGWQRCLVYTPPGALTSGKRYPVLYLQHGATEDETCWFYNGRAAHIVDNMIAAGLCEPMIIVTNNGEMRYPGTPAGPAKDTAFMDTLVGSCIPYIDANFPTKTDKWSRAIAGLSMGSGQCALVAYRNPELFGYVGMFSGMTGINETREPEAYEFASKASNIAQAFRVYFRAMGEKDESSMFQNFAKDDELMAELGIDKLPCYGRKMYPDQTHEYGAWRRMLYDYAQKLFR